MKIVSLIFLLSIAASTTFAAETEVHCWGQDEENKSIRFVVDQSESRVYFESEINNGDMPPYPFQREQTWSMDSLTFNDNQLVVTGITTGVTTGKHGRLYILGTKTGISNDYGLKRVFYKATARVTQPTTQVKPQIATVYKINCQTQTKAKPQTVGERCQDQVVKQLKTEINKQFDFGQFEVPPVSCGFENAFVSQTKYTGETVSVLEVRVDVCGGSGVEETVIENDTCKVLKTTTVSSD